MSLGFLKMRAGSADGRSFRHAYECLRNLLNRNTLLLEQMAEIEADLGFYLPASPLLQSRIARMADETLLLTEDLNVLSQDRFKGLYDAFGLVRAEIAKRMSELAGSSEPVPLVLPLQEAARASRGLAGNKACNLGRVIEVLPDHVPEGFVVSTEAYWRFLHEDNLYSTLLPLLRRLEAIQDRDLLRQRLDTIRSMIVEARIPEEIREGILRHVREQPAFGGWAVRSSGEGEDGRFSFAGQYASLLNVCDQELLHAYKQVVRSRFLARAYLYRRALGLREIDTPMAVLFMRFVAARSAGVLYTRDPESAGTECMLVQSVWGLANELVAGKMDADRFLLARVSPDEIRGERVAVKPRRIVEDPAGGVRSDPLAEVEANRPSLNRRELKGLWEAAHVLERRFGVPLDIEWVIDAAGKLWVVQARPLVLPAGRVDILDEDQPHETPLLQGGITIQPGRAAGALVRVRDGRLPACVPGGSILAAAVATPEIGTLLPSIAGYVCETGNPAGHAAALLREWRIPSLFGMKGALRILSAEQTVGLDATHRKVFRGSPWPEPAEKKGHRDPPAASRWDEDPLCKLIFPLHLVDPAAPRFRPEGCSSLHDIIRFVHQKAVETLFDLEDREANHRRRSARRLKTEIPLNIMVLDLGGALSGETASLTCVEPEEISSIPFRALWGGISDPAVSWTGRRQVSLRGLSSVLVSSMAGSGSAGRRMGERNYLLAARDYLNMNLQLAFHYAMVDALVGESPESNFVNFRFRGGGTRAGRRGFRARFLSEVLLRSRFVVDRRGDLVTAWFRRYPRAQCEQALATLGRLMGCSRQMDMLIGNVSTAHDYAEKFLSGDYHAFR